MTIRVILMISVCILCISAIAAETVQVNRKPPLKVYMVQKVADHFSAGDLNSPKLWENVAASSPFGLFPFGRKDFPENPTFSGQSTITGDCFWK